MKENMHRGMWFNPELPGYHCPGCLESVSFKELANVPNESRTEYAAMVLAYKHLHLPPAFFEVLAAAEVESVKGQIDQSKFTPGDNSRFFPLVACSG